MTNKPLNALILSFIKKNKITQINLGVKVHEIYHPLERVITLGFFGRLIKEKGFKELDKIVENLQ